MASQDTRPPFEDPEAAAPAGVDLAAACSAFAQAAGDALLPVFARIRADLAPFVALWEAAVQAEAERAQRLRRMRTCYHARQRRRSRP